MYDLFSIKIIRLGLFVYQAYPCTTYCLSRLYLYDSFSIKIIYVLLSIKIIHVRLIVCQDYTCAIVY